MNKITVKFYHDDLGNNHKINFNQGRYPLSVILAMTRQAPEGVHIHHRESSDGGKGHKVFITATKEQWDAIESLTLTKKHC